MILKPKNKFFLIIMSIFFLPLLLQLLNKLDLEVLEFFVFSLLAMLEWFLTWHFKHARIPVHTYFQRNHYFLCCLITMLCLPGYLRQIIVRNLGNNWYSSYWIILDCTEVRDRSTYYQNIAWPDIRKRVCIFTPILRKKI